MIATRLTLRDFRTYAAAEVRARAGPDGRHRPQRRRQDEPARGALLRLHRAARAGPATSASACASARSSRGSSSRCEDDAGQPHELSVGFQPGEPKRLRVDGAPVERLTDVATRPLVSVFLPDRLELVTGAPALRRAHLDQVVAALRPARAATRRAYTAALGQRNALVAAIRAGRAGRGSLPAWDAELARHGVALMADRAAVVDELRPRFAAHADGLGLVRRAGRRLPAALEGDDAPRSWRRSSPSGSSPTSSAGSPATARTATSSSCAATAASCAPTARAGSSGSALLALLLAEREALADSRGTPPLMLLDDVMSELDAGRRARLVDVLRAGGQSLITTTDLAHVPGGEDAGVTRLAIAEGAVLREAA